MSSFSVQKIFDFLLTTFSPIITLVIFDILWGRLLERDAF